MNKKKWILIGIVILILVSLNNQQKQSVAAIQGASCMKDSDCPCFGTYNFSTSIPKENATAYGVGVARCSNSTKTCDMTYCVDIQPVGEWARDTPFVWVKEHILISALILVVIIGGFLYPKV